MTIRRLDDVGRRHLLERPGRATLVGLSISLAVAVLLGVASGSATMHAGIDRITATPAGDVVVSPAGTRGSRLPADIAERLAVRGVARVGLLRTTVASVDHPEGGPGCCDTSVIAIDPNHVDLAGATVVDGRFPVSDGEVVISHEQARDLGRSIGDELVLGTPAYSARIVGVLADGAITTMAGGAVVLGLPSLADALGAPPAPSQAILALDADIEPGAWIASHRGALADVRLEDAGALRNPLEDLFGGLTASLGAISVLTLLLAAYMIHLALTSSVAQRSRTYATLLALGASRRQVLSTVMAEVLWLSVIAVIAGLGMGLVIARLLAASVADIFGTPDAGLVVRPAHLVLGSLAAIGCAATSALLPARAASRQSPAAAMTDDLTVRPASHRSTVVGVALLVLAGGFHLRGEGAMSSLGTALALLGIVLVLPDLLPRVAALLQPVTRRASPGMGEVAVAHLVKERSRSALTAGLLVAVLTIVLLAGAGYRTMAPAFEESMRLQYGSDLQVSPARQLGTTLPNDYLDRVRTLAGVAAATPMWHTQTDAAGVEGGRVLTVVDPDTHFGPAGYLFVAGDVDTARDGLRGDGVLVSHLLAQQQGWSPGDPIELLVGGRSVPFTVAATYASVGDSYARAFVIGRAAAERTFPTGLGGPNEVRIDVVDGVEASTVAGALPPIDGSLRVRYGDENTADALRQGDSVFSLFLAIQAVAAVIGLLGIGTTMAISVLERTREIGVLRALGVHISEVRRMVYVEALTLVTVGLVVAVALSWILGRNIGGRPDMLLGLTGSPRYPWSWIPGLALLSALAAMVASATPARRAARIDPCEAVRIE